MPWYGQVFICRLRVPHTLHSHTPRRMKDGNYSSHASDRKRRLWSLPVRLARSPHGGTRIIVDWGRLAVLLVTIAIAGWFGLAAAGYMFVKYQREFAEVRFTDILLPNRWDDYRIARGDHYIERAKAGLKEGNHREAFHFVRVGVGASPANSEGRLLLAQFFAVWGRADLAQRTLIEGLPYGENNPEFLKALFDFLIQNQEDAEVLAIGKRLLPAIPNATPRNQLVALAAATAQFFRGSYDDAEDLLAAYSLLRTKDGRLLQARIDWDRGARDQALIRLENCATESPGEDEYFVQLTAFHRDAGNWADVQRLAILRQLTNPNNPAPQIDLLYAYAATGSREKLRKEVDAIFRDFPANPQVILALGDFATNQGDTELASRVLDHSRFHNLGSEGPALMLAESYIVAKRYSEALALIQQFSRENPEWLKRYAAVFNGLQAIASFGLGSLDDGELYLNTFLSQPSLRVENLVAVSGRLLAIGATEPARRVLAAATRADPKNQAALTRLIELDLETGRTDELHANLMRLLTMRRPSPTLLAKAARILGSDRYYFLAGRDELLDEIERAIRVAPAVATTAKDS
jgi:thioredoxin-like negative regulator of GroEL